MYKIGLFRNRDREKTLCKGCDRFDRDAQTTCEYRIITGSCPKLEKYKGKYES